MKGKNILKVILLLLPFTILCGCSSNSNQTAAKKMPTSYHQALKQAQGKTVSYYGFGGSDTQNKWVDDVITPMMKKKGITVKRVPMDIDTIINKLTTEKEANKATGNMDVIWINGENFYNAKKIDLLAKVDPKLIPNMRKYISKDDSDVQKDMDTSIDKKEIPYGNAQLVMIGSKEMFNGDYPTSAEELLSWAKKNPGKLTYVAPPDFTGSAFIRNIIYETVGYKTLNEAPITKDGIYKAIKPSLKYLNELKPYLWQKGQTYPKTTAQLDKMFADHQVALDFSYNQMYVATQKDAGKFTDDAQTFLFDKGTIGNYNYLAIPKTSSNKAAAIVLINTMLSKEAQTKRLQPKYGATVSPYSVDKVPSEMTKVMNQSSQENGTVSMKELSKKRIPEISGKKIAITEQLWKDHVLNGK